MGLQEGRNYGKLSMDGKRLGGEWESKRYIHLVSHVTENYVRELNLQRDSNGLKLARKCILQTCM